MFPSRIAGPSLLRPYSVLCSFLCLVACMLFAPSTVAAQTMVVHRVDASDFPTLRATFYAFDAKGRPLSGLTAANVHVLEDGKERSVTDFVSPPPSAPLAVSSVFAVGTSLMMQFGAMEAAKKSMQWWVDSMLSTQSECAITTFDEKASQLLQEFSTDKEELRSAIADIPLPVGRGGYSYYDALEADTVGALDVATVGNYRKVVLLFFSDPEIPYGGNADYCNTPVAAQKEDIQINAVGFGSGIPKTVARVCNLSDGFLFDNISSADEAVEAFRKILWSASAPAPFEIEWVSDGCAQLDRRISIQIPDHGLHAEQNFEVPAMLLPQLTMEPPTSLRFRDVPPGTRENKHLTITAQRRPIHVNAITLSNPLYSITDYGGSPPPFVLDANESRALTVTFAPKDSNYEMCRIELATDGCFGTSSYAEGGNLRVEYRSDTLAVRRPNGAEQLVVGALEDLTWHATPPASPVQLEYSTDGGIHWMLIADQATGGKYTWLVPNTPSDSCLLRATRRIVPDCSIDMEFLPPGTFLMGNITNYYHASFYWGYYSDARDIEKPVHEVSISRPLLMGRTEVTQPQYEAVMGVNPSSYKSPDRPVHTLSWQEAVLFCNRLSECAGLKPCYSGEGREIVCDFDADGYRLPTEAEWEYACRAGTRTDYYTGDLPQCSGEELIPSLDAAGWYQMNTGILWEHPITKDILPVGLKKPNAFGLYDMHGNAGEYCWDGLDPDYYRTSPAMDPRGPDRRSLSQYIRVVRGGSFDGDASRCRSAFRFWVFPESSNRFVSSGFRVVRKVEF